jgi:hypothetical protein
MISWRRVQNPYRLVQIPKTSSGFELAMGEGGVRMRESALPLGHVVA